MTPEENARQEEEQMEQLKKWMEGWNLTSGTTKKRWPIFWAYVAALVATGCLTAYATYHNFQILKSADDIAKLQWWHWLGMARRAIRTAERSVRRCLGAVIARCA
jgi:hypothetical protein